MQVSERSTGIPLLLLHGAGVGGWMWGPVLDRLGPGFRAIVPDLPGFGRSSTRDYPGRETVVAELAELISRRAPEGVVVAGFSLGAQLTIALASAHPALVRGAVVISAETEPAAFRRTTLALLAMTSPLARSARFARVQARELGVPDELLDDYLRDSATTSRRTLLASVGENLAFTLPPQWSAFPGPTAVLVGQNERALMRESARLTAAAQGFAPQTVPGAAHDLPFTRPELVAAAIKRCAAGFHEVSE